MMMWFDPSREAPGTVVTSLHDSEESLRGPDGLPGQGSFEWREGVPCEGGDANLRAEWIENRQDPPDGFLDDLWVGGVDATTE